MSLSRGSTDSPFTKQSLIGMLERLGVNVRNDTLKTANVAAVMVPATLPPFARHGTRLDVTVSALGDAKSLMGGNLLVTPLIGAYGEVYAVGHSESVIRTGRLVVNLDARTVEVDSQPLHLTGKELASSNCSRCAKARR